MRRVSMYGTDTEIGEIRARARSAAVSVSEFVRRAALGRTILSVTDRQTAGELRRLGAMLKRLYPNNSSWTAEEKRRYWLGHEQLTLLAKQIERHIHGNQ
jgi:mobilization protein NikA